MHNIKLNFFKAGYGDSFLIEFDNNITLLIDGGTKATMQENCKKIESLYKKYQFNYILLTHIDDDHINGILYIFERCKKFFNSISGVFFNNSNDLRTFIPHSENEPPIAYINNDTSGLTSYTRSKKLEDKLIELDINVLSNIVSGRTYLLEDIRIQILSPSLKSFEKYKEWVEIEEEAFTAAKICDYSKSFDELLQNPFIEDDRPTNLSSISVLIEYKNKKMLFLGDSIPSDIIESLKKIGYSSKNKLSLDVVKVSHHGSKSNTSTELLEMIQSNKFLISTNGKKYGHPDKECLVRIINSQDKPDLIFNYDVFKGVFTKEEIDSKMFKIILKDEIIL